MEGGEGLGELGEVPGGGEGRVLGQEVFHLAGEGGFLVVAEGAQGPDQTVGLGFGLVAGIWLVQGWRGLTEWPDLVPFSRCPREAWKRAAS